MSCTASSDDGRTKQGTPASAPASRAKQKLVSWGQGLTDESAEWVRLAADSGTCTRTRWEAKSRALVSSKRDVKSRLSEGIETGVNTAQHGTISEVSHSAAA